MDEVLKMYIEQNTKLLKENMKLIDKNRKLNNELIDTKIKLLDYVVKDYIRVRNSINKKEKKSLWKSILKKN